MNGFIGIHIGAGNHSEKLQIQYEILCKKVCRKAAEMLKSGDSAIDVACFATKILENSELTNTGVGSNLSWEGLVECDATVMDGSTLNFGSVGAVKCVKNPIMLARKIFDDQLQTLSLQRVPPCFMVGDGAFKIAEEAGLTVPPKSLLTSKTVRSHRKYRRKAESHFLDAEENEKKETPRRNDTVGAICVDISGNVAATCSSGGIALKQSGRVGQAGVFGCGCWAQKIGSTKGVATSVSGTGEDLIRTTLAKEIAMTMFKSNSPSAAVHNTIQSSFIDSPFLSFCTNSAKLCGVIALEIFENSGEFIWAHTTNTMGIGYMSTNHSSPKVKISRLPHGKIPGSTITLEGICW